MSSHTYVVDFDEPYIRNIPTEFRPITNPNLALVASAILSGCCGHRTTVLLDERIPHRVAEETTVVVWGKTPDGTYKATAARLPAGWWVAGPAVVDEPGKP